MHSENDRAVEYDEAHMAFLELIWGDGYLSPGGPDEVDRVLAGIDLGGKTVLDLGCGSGGITIDIAKRHAPASILGLDVEDPAIQAALGRRSKLDVDVARRVDFVRVDPGPLPFADRSFDVVFSKDAMVHIPDKPGILAEILRVLKPGGLFAASDWLISHDGDPSQDMKDYLEAEGLSFGMASPDAYRKAMQDAGFAAVSTTSRNAWYQVEALRELEALRGPLRAKAEALVGPDFVDKNIRTWTAMHKVLLSGEHCPTHLRAVKSGA